MPIYEIPLKPAPQRVSVQIAGVKYQFRLSYQDVPEGGWALDIADETGAALVNGLPLVTGANLLGQYQHLGIADQIGVLTTGDYDAVPTFTNLGGAAKLYAVIA